MSHPQPLASIRRQLCLVLAALVLPLAACSSAPPGPPLYQ